MPIPLRTKVVLAAMFIAISSFALVQSASASAAPKASAQKRVKPGKKMAVRVSGFPKRSLVALYQQPTMHRGGNGFGIEIKRRYRLGKRGSGTIRFRMPKRYMACSGANDCKPKKWRRKSRVDINVCTVNQRVPVCAMAVVRLR